MLVRLAIRDIVLIDALDLAFDRGLSVLTGETGAGKSILLDAFSLALGGRGDGALVRHGAAQGQVVAAFEPPAGHPALALAAQADIAPAADLILKRVQLPDGRTRAYVNGEPVNVQTLRAIGAALVEIHGQHDDRAFVDPATHRTILDAFGALEEAVAAVDAAARRLKQARGERTDLTARVEAARREADFLRHAVEELTTLAPGPGEEATLAERRQTMMQAEKVVAEINAAYDAIAGQSSPTPFISAALRRLERRSEQAPSLVDPSVRALDGVLIALDEARGILEEVLREAAFDPRDLEQVEERLFALRAAARKYDRPADELADLAERYRADLAALDAGEAGLTALDRAVAAAEADYVAAAGRLSAGRAAAARELEAAVGRELAPLKLERSRFLVEIAVDESAREPAGFDRVEFWVQTNPGTRPGPMMKVASGGELSRFLLALKVVLADRGSAPTLIFDEIDAGVGGAVSDAIGQRLARLASRVQVMAVTHAPQVAARADAHLRIAKEMVESAPAERVATRVATLDAGERREEIARMLAGETISEEARAAAARLLAGAAG